MMGIGTYNANSLQVKVKLMWLSDVCMLLKGTVKITRAGAVAAARQADKRNKQVIFKKFRPFTNFIYGINNMRVGNAKDLDGVIPMYDLIEYSDSYSKTSGNLW